ncbi:hypothetical protein GCM10022419_042010 [Nonomuraea rosea]|uniref:Uncharacterized protein n=1 Tax=Nonomuraea rosea TaxID=638574 RepID=A0ABP6WXM8_9ACTN
MSGITATNYFSRKKDPASDRHGAFAATQRELAMGLTGPYVARMIAGSPPLAVRHAVHDRREDTLATQLTSEPTAPATNPAHHALASRQPRPIPVDRTRRSARHNHRTHSRRP